MLGLLYLKVKRNWRAWIKIDRLYLQTPYLLNKAKNANREAGVIVSLTSIKTRIKSIDHTLRSIVAGSLLPEGIYLYVDQQTHDAIIERNSFSKKLVEAGLLHIKVVIDVRSYTKLIYTLMEFPDKDIVICDDDVLYPEYWLSDLVASNKKWKHANIISCHRAHQILLGEDGKIAPYKSWPKAIKELKEPSSNIFPTGTGGVLYPAHSLPSLAWDIELFKKYAPTADDIWFWFCALSNKYKFTLVDHPFNSKKFLEVPESQSSNLFTINVHQNRNDVQMSACQEFFNNSISLS